jgi:hypothetical protein
VGVTTLTCYRLDCDGCGNPLTYYDGEGDRSGPHGETVAELIGLLYGDPDVDREDLDSFHLDGQRFNGGYTLCGRCNTGRLCAERGHRWTEWDSCWCDECDPWNRTHEERRCRRTYCDVIERRPRVTTPA